MATVKPTVRSPAKTVEAFVRVAVVKTVEEHFGLAGFIAFENRDEEHLRGLSDPDATETDFDSTDEIEAFDENCFFIEMAGTGGIFKDEDAIHAFSGQGFFRVVVGFGNPESAAIVDAKCHRLNDIGFARKKRCFESRRQRDRGGGILRF